MEEIAQHFAGTTIFISGATGFLAKIFLEKILRIQPLVKKVFLLIRATSKQSAEQRLQQEVLRTELFRVMEEEFGANLNCLLLEKIIPISGDVSLENLGIVDLKLREEIWGEVDIIVNSAATTKFDERYDVALGINALGAMNVLNFARNCSNLKMLLHVSTAYVNGTREGLIPETPFRLGETLAGAKISYLDIEREKKIVEETLKELQSHNATEKQIKSIMKDLGIERALLHGWPNTYVFTKAMGEMLLGVDFKEKTKVIIIRPTIITSTLIDPFPGWIEGLRTLDSIFVAYGKGKMKVFIGDLQSTLDIIPGDMVVNSMLAAMATYLSKPSHELVIYHVGSSLRNPIKYRDIFCFVDQYLKKNPLVDNRGKPVKVGKLTILGSMTSFHRYLRIHCLPFLKMLKLLNVILCNHCGNSYANARRTMDYAIRLAELYKPYAFPNAIFDDFNSENLRRTMRGSNSNVDVIGFDPKCIQWEEYFTNIHFPGIIKHVVK